MAKKIVLKPVVKLTDPYKGHGTSVNAPQVKDALHIPNVPEIRGRDLAKALGVDKAMGPEKKNTGTIFKK